VIILFLKIIRVWQSANRIVSILVETEKTVEARPGDFAVIDGKHYPILSVKKQAGVIKIDIIADEVPENIKMIEFKESAPELGKAYIVGSVSDWLIAGVRLGGYEISEKIEEADVILILEPTYIHHEITVPRIIAPKVTASVQEILELNNLLRRQNLSIAYDVSKPLRSEKNFVTITVPSYGIKCIIPSQITIYPLKTIGEFLSIAFAKDGSPVIAFDPRTRTYVLSSIAFLMPYDMIENIGENTRLLHMLVKQPPRAPMIAKEEKIKVQPSYQEATIHFENLDKTELFGKIIEQLMLAGALLKERNDSLKKATLFFPGRGTDRYVELYVSIRDNKVVLGRSDSSFDDIGNYVLHTAKAIVESTIEFLRERNRMRDKFRKILLLVMEVQKRLITIKDMIELDMNPYMILSDLREASSLLSSEKAFESLILEIDATINELEDYLKSTNAFSEDHKNKLLADIDKWLARIREIASSL